MRGGGGARAMFFINFATGPQNRVTQNGLICGTEKKNHTTARKPGPL